MYYEHKPNLFLESLACLGRTANGHTWSQMETQLRQKNVAITAPFADALALLSALTARLDPQTILKEAEHPGDFQNLPGFPRNTIGSASPAFFVLYGLLERTPDTRALEDYAAALTPEQTAYHLALALDLADDWPGGAIPTQIFLDMVLALSLPDSSKITILNILRDFPGWLHRILPPVQQLLNRLSREQKILEELSDILNEKILHEGCEAYLSRTSRLVQAQDIRYRLRPFLFGMDTTLSSQLGERECCIYCGILRDEMLEMLHSRSDHRDTVCEALRLLGDRTRFDLVCYLRDHEAYGQELSAKFGISRNTIHHHMSKLSAVGLVRCTASGSRVYYKLDQEVVLFLLQRQRELFYPGLTESETE